MLTLNEVLEDSPLNVNLLLNGVSAGEAGAVMLQQHISKTPELQVLELRGSTVGPGGCARIARALHDHPCIRHIGLARNGLDLSSTLELLSAAATCRMLQALDLEWNGLDDSAASVLAKWLAQLDCSLVALNLERNFIGRNGAIQLAAAVAQNTSLHSLNIGHMRCEFEAAQAWGAMLTKNSTLLTFNCSGTELLTDSTRHILLGLKQNRSLRALSLQYCQGLTALSEIGSDMGFAMSMKDLNMQGSRAAPNEAAARGFAAAIQHATGLVGLNISRCAVSDAAMIQMLAGGVSFVMSLQVFDASACGMSDASMGAMTQVLDRCINLHTLSMDDNAIGPRGAQILAEGLAKASALTTLSISNCDLRNAGTVAVALALRRKQIMSLRVSNNQFDIDGGKALVQALLDDPGYRILRELDVSHNRLTARYAALLGQLFKRHQGLMPICVRGTSISQAVNEAYVDALSVAVSTEAQAAAEDEIDQQRASSDAIVAASSSFQQTKEQQQQQQQQQHQGGKASSSQQQKDSASRRNKHDQQQQQQQQHVLTTNFHGASPTTRAMPAAVFSDVGPNAHAAIQQHKVRGSWLDSEFGEAINTILNATTNFRSATGTYSLGDEGVMAAAAALSPGKGGVGIIGNASSSSPHHHLRRGAQRRADALQGGAVGSSTDPIGGLLVSGGTSRFTLAASASTHHYHHQQQQQDGFLLSSDGMSSLVSSGLPAAAQAAVDSLAKSKGGCGAVSSSSSAAMAASTMAGGDGGSILAASTRELQRQRGSAGGFIEIAGLAPRTEPSPMWARRPQLHDMEACVGDDLCVSEPQLRLLFMELDKGATGVITRGEAESAYRRFCIEFDDEYDGKRLDRFFEKYLPQHFGGPLAKALSKRKMVGGAAAADNGASPPPPPQPQPSSALLVDSGSAGARQHAAQNLRVVTYDVFSMLMLSLVNR